MEQVLANLCEMARKGMVPITALQALINEYDPVIMVDRTALPIYPVWVKAKLNPQLENTGPPSFDVSKLEQWLHPMQIKGRVKGNVVYELLERESLLEGCLGLADLLAIQWRGRDLSLFRKHFAGKNLFAWKSTVQSTVLPHGIFGGFQVPYLTEAGGSVIVDWCRFGYSFCSHDIALRFAKQD